MNKRGVSQDFVPLKIFEILTGIMAGGILIYAMIMFGSNRIFNQNYIADDLALTIHAVVAAPGDVSVTYAHPALQDYLIKVNGNLLSVMQYSNDAKKLPFFQKKASVRQLAFSSKVPLDETFVRPKMIVISKINGAISISESEKEYAASLWKE